MAKVSLAVKLREMEERYRKELMGEEERLELLERILRLKKRAATKAEAGRS